MAGHEQIPLPFEHSPRYSAAAFLPADCNAEALGWILRWPKWPQHVLALIGPAGSGKSHLAHLFRDAAGGVLIAAADLTEEMVPCLAEAAATVVEDGDQGVDEMALFHLHNLLRETGRSLLLTGRRPPARWSVALADLRSRLAAVPVTTIGSPDDGLLAALLGKLFDDRQLKVGPDVVSYLVQRMERSCDAARTVVAALDVAALTQKRPITLSLARDVLAALEPPPRVG
jgi:chromosomal replication initiation ATPase DnaA